jgi:hypothetical protein
MSQDVNGRENLIKRIGPVWKIKVAVYSPVKKAKSEAKVGIKRWKIKEILN